MNDLLARREFRRLVIGQAVSALGDWMGTVALMVLVLELSGSSTAVAGVLVLRLLPSAVAAPIVSRVVARWDRRRVMLGCDLVRLVMVLLLPLVPWLGWVYFWAFAIEVAGLAFLPARDAAIPVLAEDPNGVAGAHQRAAVLTVANGIMLATSYGTIPLGAGGFGLVVLLTEWLGWADWRFMVVFWLDALTFLASYLAIRGLGDLGPGERPAEDAREREYGPGSGSEGQAGFLAALRIPLVRGVLPAVVTAALGLGALFSLGVVYVQDVLRAGPVEFGVLVALFGVGAVAGLVLLRRRAHPNLLAQVRSGVALQGAVIAVMSVLATTPLAFIAAVVFGAVTTVVLVSALSLVQESLDGTERTLALAAFHITTRFALAAAALLSGAAADLVGPVRLGTLGTLQPAQAVLLASGLVVASSAALVRHPALDDPEA